MSRQRFAVTVGSAVLVFLIVCAACGSQSSSRARFASLSQSSKSGQQVTFTHDIAPLLDSQCVSCHRAGEVAPFALTDYESVKEHADMIAVVTEKRVMPPWHASPGYGDFQGVRHLSDTQIAMLRKWADEGEPEGNPALTPPMPKFTSGWTLGTPDLVLEMPESYSIPAGGNDIYQCFVLPTGIADDRYVSAVEFRPGDSKVVHHAIVYLDNRGVARGMLNSSDPAQGFRSFGGPGFLPSGILGGWAPGAYPHLLPNGIADYMAGKSDVVLQIHYHPIGKAETDRSKIGIYFAKGDVNQITAGIPLWQPHIAIPPGDRSYTLNAQFTTPVDCQAIGIIPHMHLLGRQMKVTAYLPDGTEKAMIWVKDWNFNWQDQYRYKSPVDLPAGTRLAMTATYDNSDANPFNPNSPPKEVKLGEQTTDEMALCVVQVVTKKPEDRRLLTRAVVRSFLGVGRTFSPNI